MTDKSYPGSMTAMPIPSPQAPPDEDYLRLDQQICFSLNATSRAFGSVYRVILKDLGSPTPSTW